MADAPKAPLTWPTASWKMLKKIVRAWYTAEESGGEITQRGIAKIANVQASRVSMNKPFLQTIGIVQPEGIALTEGGKNLGLGVSNENEKVTQQALQRIIRENALLRQLLDIIKGRGTTDRTDFEAEVLILTKQGKGTPFFSTGVSVLEDILLESGLVAISDNTLRPSKNELRDEPRVNRKEEARDEGGKILGLRQIPIPVSASVVWYIQVGENPEDTEIDKFIEMQRLIFGRK